MKLEDVYVFRMTHIGNISHILQYGITHRTSLNANPDYISIGDDSLINKRANAEVVISETYNKIILGNFIPFYFWVRMPMLYIIQNGFHEVARRRPEEIIYLVCSAVELSNNYNEIYFSDGHAVDRFSSVYDKTKLTDVLNLLDWNAIKSRTWSGIEDTDLKRRKEAEFLVKDDISPQFIKYYACYDDITKRKLMYLGVEEAKIKIIPKGYY